MKIAIITDHIPSQWAHSINTMKHAQGFLKLGHDVEILVIRRIFEDKNFLKVKNIVQFYDIDKNIKIKYFRDYSLNYFKEIRFLGPYLIFVMDMLIRTSSILKYLFDPERRIINYCKKEDIDLIYCRRTQNVPYYAIINKKFSIFELHQSKKDTILDLLIKLKNSNFIKGIITIESSLKESFIKKGFLRDKVIVIEDAVDLERYNQITIKKSILREKLNLPLNKKIIMYTGNLANDRGIDIIINAAKNLDKDKFSFYLIGGRNKEIKKWKKYIRENKIDCDITFLKFISNTLIPYYLKSADILLAPYSLKCRTIKWMSPLKIFEYMASKIPMIASDVDRIKELCGNNESLLFNVDNPRDLSQKIKILLNNTELQNKLINNAYEKAKNHSYKKRCEKILEFVG